MNSKPNIHDFHERWRQVLVVAASASFIVWLLSFGLSYFNETLAYWVGILGMLASGVAIYYRGLRPSGLIPNLAVGFCVAVITLVAAGLISFSSLPVNPIYVCSIGLGLLVGWVADALGRRSKENS